VTGRARGSGYFLIGQQLTGAELDYLRHPRRLVDGDGRTGDEAHRHTRIGRTEQR
jgi:hypothetical protein